VVCTRDDAPNPSIPRNTLAPASPAACARCTISAYSGRWLTVSLSPINTVNLSALPVNLVMSASS